MATYPGLFFDTSPTTRRVGVPSGAISLADPKQKLAAELRGQYSLLTKSPAQAERATGLASVFDTNLSGGSNGQPGSNQILTDWTRDYLAGGPAAKSNAAQESASIGRWYGSGPGSVSGDLDRMTREKNAAVNMAVQQAIGRAGRSNNILRMNRGDTSYADNQYASILANIAAQEAARQADEQRGNYMTTLEGQRAMLGQRNQIVDNALTRDLVPLDTQNRMLGSNLSLLSGLAGLEDNNSLMVSNPVVPPIAPGVASAIGAPVIPGLAAPVPALPAPTLAEIAQANQAREAQADSAYWKNYFAQQGIQVPAGLDVSVYQNLYRQLQAQRAQPIQSALNPAPVSSLQPFAAPAPQSPYPWDMFVPQPTSQYYDPNAPRRIL